MTLTVGMIAGHTVLLLPKIGQTTVMVVGRETRSVAVLSDAAGV